MDLESRQGRLDAAKELFGDTVDIDNVSEVEINFETFEDTFVFDCPSCSKDVMVLKGSWTKEKLEGNILVCNNPMCVQIVEAKVVD